MNPPQVGIVGAGPAGITAALQLTRYGIPVALFEAHQPGGLLRNANWVENYPGFPAGIRGQQLADEMTRHLQAVGANVIHQEVHTADWDGSEFLLHTESTILRCHFLIIASGTQAVHLPDGIVKPEASDSVFYEVVHLPQRREAQIAIIGGGDAAFDYALQVSQSNPVTIFNRSQTPRCLPLLWQRASQSSAIRYVPNAQIQSIERRAGNKLEMILNQNGERKIETAELVLVAIGRQPALNFLSSTLQAQLDSLEQACRCWRIGDVKNGLWRQTAIAVGDGMKAAMQISHMILEVTQ